MSRRKFDVGEKAMLIFAVLLILMGVIGAIVGFYG